MLFHCGFPRAFHIIILLGTKPRSLDLSHSGSHIFMYMFQNGQTFLMTACQAGDVSIVKELLDSGLDPNGVDNVRNSCSNWKIVTSLVIYYTPHKLHVCGRVYCFHVVRPCVRKSETFMCP